MKLFKIHFKKGDTKTIYADSWVISTGGAIIFNVKEGFDEEKVTVMIVSPYNYVYIERITEE